MKNENKFKSIGEILKYIRNSVNLTQSKFVINLGKSRDWYKLKELDKSKIYIKDFIDILKVYKYDLLLYSNITGVTFSLRQYEASAILRFMRESTGLSQVSFANSIGKKRTWQSGNEAGVTQYYANDLFELIVKHEFSIKIIKK